MTHKAMNALLDRAVRTLQRNTLGPEGKPWAPHRGIIPAFGTYEGVWNWDAAFHALAVSRWDPEAAAQRIELAVGRDLQFIRLNGTLVGGLAGLVIYSLSRLLP